MPRIGAERLDILCLCSWHGVGGAETNAARLSRAFRERGYNTALGFLFEREPNARLDVEDYFVVAPGQPRGPISWLRFLARCRSEIAQRKPRVAFGFHPMANVVGALAVGLSGGRFIGTQRNPSCTQSRGVGWIEGVLGSTRLYHANIAVSRAVAESYVEHRQAYRDKLIVVYNDPPTLPEVRDSPQVCRERLGIRAGNPVLGCIGRLHEQKNFSLAIGAVRGLPEAHLYIAGDGPQGLRLRNFASSLSITERVHFIGTLGGADVSRFYRAVDLILMPSSWEGHPLVMLEAMSAGVPIVAHDIPALREVGGDAVRYCGSDPKDWERAVADIDEHSKERMISAGLKRAELFRQQSMVDMYLQVAGLPSISGEKMLGSEAP